MEIRRKIAVAAIVGALMLVPVLQSVAGESFYDSSTGRQIALGAGSGLLSLVYSPLKFIYASGATITGGLILAFTAGQGKDTAAVVVRRGVRGDWWVHPDVLTGNRKLKFVGEP